MRRHENKGRKPRAPDDTLVMVEFRNGRISGPHPVSYWRWEPWPWGESDFDNAALLESMSLLPKRDLAADHKLGLSMMGSAHDRGEITR